MEDNTYYKLASTVCRELSERTLHPAAFDAFRRLAYDLDAAFRTKKTPTLFKPFETYRHPMRQHDLYSSEKGVTRARQFESAHQFGFAVDFVAFDNGRWSWEATKDWPFLKAAAERQGLLVPLTWDRAHVEHPRWQDFRACLKSM